MKTTNYAASLALILGLVANVLVFAGSGGLSENEWNIRLTVESAAENLVDNGNLLGQLEASSMAYDRFDLEELPPFASPYLTIVFPHQNWGARAADYTVDYQAPSTSAQWEFVVRSDDPNRDVTISWDGTSAGDRTVFMHLVDVAANTHMPAQASNSYSFNMSGQQERHFVWVYSSGRLGTY